MSKAAMVGEGRLPRDTSASRSNVKYRRSSILNFLGYCDTSVVFDSCNTPSRNEALYKVQGSQKSWLG